MRACLWVYTICLFGLKLLEVGNVQYTKIATFRGANFLVQFERPKAVPLAQISNR